MLPNVPRFAQLFLQEHAGKPLLVEESAMAGYVEPRSAGEYPDGIAVIGIYGMLTEDSPWWGTSYSRIREKVQAAVDHPECQGILLDIDSPGGSTDHAFETAEFLADAAKKKPIWAVANVNCYSAAYLLASAASRIIAAPTSGGTGSIGVYAAHVEFSGMLEKEGIGVTLISAGKGKTDGNPYEPLSPEAQKKIQGEVDRLYSAFVGFVSRHRGMSAEAITKLGADLKHGADAVTAGLADDTGTLDEVMETFRVKVTAPKISAQAPAGASSTKEDIQMSDVNQAGANANAVANSDTVGTVAKDATGPTFAQAQEVIEMCEMAGIPGKSKEMTSLLSTGKSMADVRRAIIDAKADASKEEIRSNVAAGAKSAEKKNVLLGAVDRLAGTFGAIARQEGAR